MRERITKISSRTSVRENEEIVSQKWSEPLHVFPEYVGDGVYAHQCVDEGCPCGNRVRKALWVYDPQNKNIEVTDLV